MQWHWKAKGCIKWVDKVITEWINVCMKRTDDLLCTGVYVSSQADSRVQPVFDSGSRPRGPPWWCTVMCASARQRPRVESHEQGKNPRQHWKGTPVSTLHPEIVEKISGHINWASARVIRQLYLNLALLINHYSHISTRLYKIIRAVTLNRVCEWHFSRGRSMISVFGGLSLSPTRCGSQEIFLTVSVRGHEFEFSLIDSFLK